MEQSMEMGVLNAEVKRCEALKHNDAAALAALLSDELVFVHSSGTQDNKAQLLGKISVGTIRYVDVRFTELRAQPLPGGFNALLAGLMEATIVVGGIERRIRSRYLTVWCREDDGVLRLWAHQGTALPVV